MRLMGAWRRSAGGSLLRALLWSAALSGCGYHALPSQAPFGASRIAVVPFEEVMPSGVATMLADHLARELAAGGVHLMLQAQDADAILSGKISWTSAAPSPAASRARIAAYQVRATIAARLTDQQGKVLWQTTLHASEDFLPPPAGANSMGPAPVEVDRNYRLALERLAERAARNLRAEMLIEAAL